MKRRDAEVRGRRAENIAVLWLKLKGYRILGRRVRTPLGEVDIVARRRQTLAFVEVKARDSDADADAAVAPHQLRRVARAANLLLARFLGDCAGARIDAIIVSRGRMPRHIEGIVDGLWR